MDYEQTQISRGGRRTVVRSFPISVDFEAINQEAQGIAMEREMAQLTETLGITDELVGVGLDRIDYTKGLPERFLALAQFLETHPEYHERIVFLQMGATNRLLLSSYQSVNEEIDSLVYGINDAVRQWEVDAYHLPPW